MLGGKWSGLDREEPQQTAYSTLGDCETTEKKFTLSDETETWVFHSSKSAKCGRRLCVLLSVLSDLVTLPDNVQKVHNWLCNIVLPA